MAKLAGFEVTGVKPVCIDFPDGRVVSFRPGMRFQAHPTNASVRRLMSVREVRALGPFEPVPALPVKLGAPKSVRNTLETRKKLAAARRLAEQRLKKQKQRAPKATTPDQMKPVDLSALNQPKRKQKSSLADDLSADN